MGKIESSEDFLNGINKELAKNIGLDIEKILENILAKELLNSMFDEFDKENSLPINAEDVLWMPKDEYNEGYWYNRVTGKILTNEEIKILNL